MRAGGGASMLPAMTTITAVDEYIQAWNEREDAPRRALVERAFADGAAYLDGHRSGAGHAELDAMIAAAQGQFPGHRIELTAGPDALGDRLRFSYQLVGPDGAVGGGTDFVTVAADGRFADVTGFSDPA